MAASCDDFCWIRVGFRYSSTKNRNEISHQRGMYLLIHPSICNQSLSRGLPRCACGPKATPRLANPDKCKFQDDWMNLLHFICFLGLGISGQDIFKCRTWQRVMGTNAGFGGWWREGAQRKRWLCDSRDVMHCLHKLQDIYAGSHHRFYCYKMERFSN